MDCATAQILTTGGEVVLIDKEDEPFVAPIRWRVATSKSGRRFVVTANEAYAALARFVTGVPKGVHIRHLNDDPLDCRKGNLHRIDVCMGHVIEGDTAKVMLVNSDLCALVDACDVPLVVEVAWYLNSFGYAWSGAAGAMHRLLLNIPDDRQVDHANRNKLDNRRSNLREATSSEQSMNTRKMSWRGRPASSRFKGVYRDARTPSQPYKVTITANKKQIFVGRFADEITAAYAYDTKARELFGEFACTNADLGLL